MAKNIVPEEGIPADVLLSDLEDFCDASGSDREAEMYKYRDDVYSIRALVNPDVCVNISQQRWLEHEFADAHSPSSSNLDTMEMVNVINNFRLDCCHCLRENCPRRDVNAPLNEVKKGIQLWDDCYEGRLVEKDPSCSVDIVGGCDHSPLTDPDWDFLIVSKLRTVRDVCSRTEKELLAMPGSSPEIVERIKEMLAKNGWELKKTD